MIPIFSNTLGTEELDALEQVFASRWLGPGKQQDAFEREWLNHVGGEGHVLLTNCCTSALYIALRVMGVRDGAEVIVPSIHFVATVNGILELGGKPVFCDVGPHTLNVRAQDIEPLITKRTAGVVLLHYGGHPVDFQPIHDLCRAYNLWIIEDAANGPASMWHGKSIGTLGDAGVWSFDSMKILVMGDGGALWLSDAAKATRAQTLRNMGLGTLSGTDALKHKQRRWWEYTVVEPNGRFDSNDIAAAIGRAQLIKLPSFIMRRAQIWQAYQTELAGIGDLILPPEPLSNCTTSYYMYWLQTARRDALARYLVDHGIYVTFRYYPLSIAFRDSTAKCPNAIAASEHALCLPLHQNLSDADVDKIIMTVKDFYCGN